MDNHVLEPGLCHRWQERCRREVIVKEQLACHNHDDYGLGIAEWKLAAEEPSNGVYTAYLQLLCARPNVGQLAQRFHRSTFG